MTGVSPLMLPRTESKELSNGHLRKGDVSIRSISQSMPRTWYLIPTSWS